MGWVWEVATSLSLVALSVTCIMLASWLRRVHGELIELRRDVFRLEARVRDVGVARWDE